MKVRRYNGRDASRRVLLTDTERTEAEAIVRERYPDASEIHAHPLRGGIYCEVYRQWAPDDCRGRIVRVA